MSTGPDSGDVWLIGTILGVLGVAGGWFSGLLSREGSRSRQAQARDEKLSVQIKLGDEKLSEQIKASVDDLHARISRAQKESSNQDQRLLEDLTDFKLYVEREYASREHLREVENRLAKAIENLTSKLDAMPSQLAHELKQVAVELKEAVREG